MPIQRSTCFKLKSLEDAQGMMDAYKTVEQTQQRDGKPYILSISAHRTLDDPRSQGYNFVANTTFANIDDVKYYDEQCEAHQKLKAFAKDKVAGPPLVLHIET
ncbi:hypothetical protein KC332_g9675 [Hortaea werneckii]|uniref:Stress-response A/B barrel domain-containing protein n=2 Tax=Hortaea werneckii TaxID=91943 RepID=A0A3M7INS6_HORWE|nr:hypothetical protein KC350_g12649 [Hortaea werneckii]OTA36720.1 hypothetical protein BTJ68_03286 [Hortaea werneckii EXF-2000]KAI6826559.1 hypothetical protein KC358_g7754 [Hortaea werneckii]KAI6927998.1 hypothetical protein KC348_g8225 [Hortaea werneckii]KAI6934389.1 hypothetical protein KC341_g7639 [Hortaea werneckii]